MPRHEHKITHADILPMADYGAMRKAKRAEITELKKNRRLSVGPYATFYFENYDTMWMQIHEMLFIEKGGEEQIADELRAYNPLIPQGSELVATVMFEIEDQVRRDRELRRMGGVENFIALKVGGETIKAVSESEVERTTDDGKTSSVHFFHFPFTAAQIAAFSDPAVEVLAVITHENYGHMALLPAAMRAALAKDFT